jgi:hypothetical protein
MPLALEALPPAKEMMLAAALVTGTAGLGTAAGVTATFGLAGTGFGTTAGDTGVARVGCLVGTGDGLAGAGLALSLGEGLGDGLGESFGFTGSGTGSLVLGLGTAAVLAAGVLAAGVLAGVLAGAAAVRLAAAAAASATAFRSFWRSSCCSLRPVVLTQGAPSYDRGAGAQVTHPVMASEQIGGGGGGVRRLLG